MNRTQSPVRRRAARAARWLATAAFSGLALTFTAATQAQATAAVTARVPAMALTAPAPISLNANWTGNAGFGSRPPAWYTDGSGVVHLQGAVHQISASGTTVIGTLPRAARPASFLHFIVHTFAGTYADIVIGPLGKIGVIQPFFPAIADFSFVSLEGITYRPARPGNPIAVNTVNWTGHFTNLRPPAWYTDRSGVVHLQGIVSQTSATGTEANLIGILPPAAIPARTVYTVVTTGGSFYADLAIESNGQIALIDPRLPANTNHSLVSLEGITYSPSRQGTPIPLNTANWTGSAGFDSRHPAWYKDSSGITHLQGAAAQTSAAGTGANLIATLPAAARPTHTVYTIVHTFQGTYADLAILPSGQIALIDPRPPMVKDYTFVSLESITYRR